MRVLWQQPKLHSGRAPLPQHAQIFFFFLSYTPPVKWPQHLQVYQLKDIDFVDTEIGSANLDQLLSESSAPPDVPANRQFITEWSQVHELLDAALYGNKPLELRIAVCSLDSMPVVLDTEVHDPRLVFCKILGRSGHLTPQFCESSAGMVMNSGGTVISRYTVT